MAEPSGAGYAPVDGVAMYWESFGAGGTPVVLVHGGYGLISGWGALLDTLARRRRVVAVELQGHGHTRDVDRPFTWETFGDDLAGLVASLDLGRVDLVGYSLGGTASLRAAVQHPERVRRLALISIPVRRDGWYPEVRAAFDHMDDGLLDQMRQSPLYAAWAAVAPDPDAFPTLINKTGELLRRPYDWSADVGRLPAETLLVYADNDSIPLSHIAEFYALLGGGHPEPGWDPSRPGRPAARLAIVPGTTHYDIAASPRVATLLDDHLR